MFAMTLNLGSLSPHRPPHVSDPPILLHLGSLPLHEVSLCMETLVESINIVFCCNSINFVKASTKRVYQLQGYRYDLKK